MTVRAYYSTDSGAPVLSGTAGALIGVLTACLVTGYGSKTASGWSKDFTGTNLATFRPSEGTRFYLRVDDTGSTSARVRGFESMSDVNTGTGLFPTDAQVSGGGYVQKSNSSDATARGWALFADQKRFILVSASVASTIAASATAGYGMYFGDFISNKLGDAYNCILIAGHAVSSPQLGTGSTGLSAVNGHWVARAFTQTGGSILVGKHSDYVKGGATTTIGSGGAIYPDPITGGLNIAPLYISEDTSTRGVLPGLWAPLHNLPGQPGDTFSGAGALSAKTFMLADASSSSSRARVAVEISDTWG